MKILILSLGSRGDVLPYATLARALQHSYGQLNRHLPMVLNDQRLLDIDLVLNQLPSNLYGEDIAEMIAHRTKRRVSWAVLSVIPLARTVNQPLFGFQTLVKARVNI